MTLAVVLTFFLGFVAMGVTIDDRAVGQAAVLTIDGAVLLNAVFGGLAGDASMNPASSQDRNIVWLETGPE